MSGGAMPRADMVVGAGRLPPSGLDASGCGRACLARNCAGYVTFRASRFPRVLRAKLFSVQTARSTGTPPR